MTQPEIYPFPKPMPVRNRARQGEADIRVGLYARLSDEDLRNGESMSIENQKLLLTKYCVERGWNTYKIYEDDGWSGTNFNRPGIQALLADAQNGEINHVICTDLSRLGRNYAYVGWYTETFFPQLGVRFLAINDSYDSDDPDCVANDIAPFLNIFNEWHCKTTSKKVRSAKTARAKIGKFMSPNAPFGYIKDPDDKNHLIIDEKTAAVVQQLFEKRAAGASTMELLRWLVDKSIPTPTECRTNAKTLHVFGHKRSCAIFLKTKCISAQ